MTPHKATRPGSTPIVQIDGDTVIYRMWISRESRDSEMLVLRCASDGKVVASIEADSELCNHHTPPPCS